MLGLSEENLDKNVKLWKDVLTEDQQWDFTFLEKIILHKVKLMRDFYLEGNSHIEQESVDETVKEMTVAIQALERLLKNDYIQIPEGKRPKMKTTPVEGSVASNRITWEYHPDFGEDKLDEAYRKAEEDERIDRALVYDTLRDKSTGWWD